MYEDDASGSRTGQDRELWHGYAGRRVIVRRGFSNHPLIEYVKSNSNVIILPHIDGMTRKSYEDTNVFMTNKLAAHLEE